MTEHDFNKERVLSGETVDTQNQAEIAEVKLQLLEHVRIRKGLSSTPVQLDVEAISQLTDAKIIDENQPEYQNVGSRIIDISTLPPSHSAVGVAIRAERLKKLKKAA